MTLFGRKLCQGFGKVSPQRLNPTDRAFLLKSHQHLSLTNTPRPDHKTLLTQKVSKTLLVQRLVFLCMFGNGEPFFPEPVLGLPKPFRISQEICQLMPFRSNLLLGLSGDVQGKIHSVVSCSQLSSALRVARQSSQTRRVVLAFLCITTANAELLLREHMNPWGFT